MFGAGRTLIRQYRSNSSLRIFIKLLRKICLGSFGDCVLVQDPNTQEILIYKGWEETLKYVEDYIADNGPFDGFWAFSQVSSRLHLAALHHSLAAELCLFAFTVSLDALVSHALQPVQLGTNAHQVVRFDRI